MPRKKTFSLAERYYIEQHRATKTPAEIASDLGVKEVHVVDFVGSLPAPLPPRGDANFARRSGTVAMTAAASHEGDEVAKGNTSPLDSLRKRMGDCIHIIRPGEPVV